MALIGLYSGRKILANKDKRGYKLTRTQTAKQAYNAIMTKYKEIKPNAKYHHVGKGVWLKYNKAADAKRTGKVTSDIKKWRRQPHKLDYKGIDTKGVVKGKPKKPTGDLTKYISLFRKYLRACNIKPVNGEILVTCIDKPEAIAGVKMYLSDAGYKNYEKAGKVVIVGGPSISFKTKPPMEPFEGNYKGFVYKVDTKKGVITFRHPKLTGMGDYSTGPTYFNVNTVLKKDIVELAERMINKTLDRITYQLAPAQLSQRGVRRATAPRKNKGIDTKWSKVKKPQKKKTDKHTFTIGKITVSFREHDFGSKPFSLRG